MELKRRIIHNNGQHQKERMEEMDGDSLALSCKQDNEPGIPSRKSIHSKPQKKANKLAFGYASSLLAILLVFGGSGWWMKSQIAHNATAVSTPQVKKMEPNKEVQNKEVENKEVPSKQAEISNTAPKELSMAKVEQPLNQKMTTQPPTKTPQHSESATNTKPANGKKIVVKPVYKKIIRHKVGVGETLYRISLKYYHTGRYATFLGKHNHIQDPSNLISGTFIKIPFPPGK